MSKFIGPVHKKSRRLGFSILENEKEFTKGKQRTGFVPGYTAKWRGIKKQSNYRLQLQSKQKLRFLYNLTEKQLKRMYKKAAKDETNTSLVLFQLLESRLDNLVFRMNLASTRAQARQLVNHGHILVDGKKVDIPSAIIKPDSKISVVAKMTKNNFIEEALNSVSGQYPFVKVNKKELSGVYLRFPKTNEVKIDYDMALVTEYYNR